MNYKELTELIKRKKSFLCVGLDPDLQKIPSSLLGDEMSLFTFCREIIDRTAEYAVAFKLNVAFFEAYGSAGYDFFEKTIAYIKEKYPDVLTIADAKRGDIGNTVAMYANAFLREMGFDAITLSPYMGADSVKPFLSIRGKWVIVLALTSNSGSGDFQTLRLENGAMLYEEVLKKSASWGTVNDMMFVVGATKSENLAGIRKIAPDNFLLVPGIGAQGGSLEDVAKYGMNENCGLLINASRSIIYASGGSDYALRAADEARKIQQKMETLLAEHKII